MAEDESVTDMPPDAVHWLLTFLLLLLLSAGFIHCYRVLKRPAAAMYVRRVPEGMHPMQCGACRTVQYIPVRGRIFQCYRCHRPNRVPEVLPADLPRPQHHQLVSHTGPLRSFRLKREGENFFQETERVELPEHSEEAQALVNQPTVFGNSLEDGGNIYSECLVCQDKPGNIVILACGHGSVCQECTNQIAHDRGGAQCPLCRSPIEVFVRIRGADGEQVDAIEYRIEMVRPL